MLADANQPGPDVVSVTICIQVHGTSSSMVRCISEKTTTYVHFPGSDDVNGLDGIVCAPHMGMTNVYKGSALLLQLKGHAMPASANAVVRFHINNTLTEVISTEMKVICSWHSPSLPVFITSFVAHDGSAVMIVVEDELQKKIDLVPNSSYIPVNSRLIFRAFSVMSDGTWAPKAVTDPYNISGHLTAISARPFVTSFGAEIIGILRDNTNANQAMRILLMDDSKQKWRFCTVVPPSLQSESFAYISQMLTTGQFLSAKSCAEWLAFADKSESIMFCNYATGIFQVIPRHKVFNTFIASHHNR